MIKNPVRLRSFFGSKGIISAPLLLGGVVVVGIIIVLATTGVLKFSAKVNTSGSSQNQAESAGSAESSSKPASQKSESSVQLVEEPYTDSQLGFSIQYAQDWKVRSETTGVTIYLPSTVGSEEADALVLVSTAPLGEFRGSKLTSIADLQKVQLEKQFSGMKVISEKETKVGDADAYEVEFTAVLKGENVHAKYSLLMSSADLYGVLSSANEAMWSKYKDYLNASVSSFKLQ